MFCGKCGAKNVDRIKFCTKCGSDMTTQTPQSRKASSDPLDDLETSIVQEVDPSSFEKGSLFANRYEILDEGKKGGMGAVYKCKDTKLNKIVALKIIHPRLLSSQQALSRFRQEVSISQELQHPNIVKVFNLEEWEDKEYFTMEWVEGMSLREVIIKRKAENLPFRLEEAYKIISQLADALNHAHKYTIHRDIKPENILVTDEKDFRVKLTDFGIAKMLSPSQFTSTSIQMGTPYYMAPEQKVDAGNVDKRADIYALGVVLFELLTLENTIGLKLPSQINKQIPKKIDDILVRALEPKPQDRYGDVKELSDELDHILTEEKKSIEEVRQQEEQKREEAKEQKMQEEEQLRKMTEEKKRKEVEEADRKRESDRQETAKEEKTKIETEKKKLEAENNRIEREKRKIEEERAQAEGQRIRQEQAKKEEEARQRRLQEDAQKKKSPMWMIGIVVVVIIGIFIYIQHNKSVQDPILAEAPSSAPQNKPEVPQTGSIAMDEGKYAATVYIAGHGGHFAKAEVTVDPNNSENPIKINGDLEMVNIGTTISHKIQSALIDSNDRTVMFWATYSLDEQGKMHIGKSDLKTGKVIKDIAINPDERAPGRTGPLYVASGQSKTYYMPVFMGSEAYVDVFAKGTLELKHRVFISDLGYKSGTYKFLHGTNSNNMKKFILAVTMKGEDGKMNGKIDFLMLDLPSLENGKFKVLARSTLIGEPSKTITFSQYFSEDDKLIFQSAGDRMLVIEAATLKLVDTKMTGGWYGYGENHDVMPSPDGKYALLTLRTSDTTGCDSGGRPIMDREGKPLRVTDGVLGLYDVSDKKLIGKTVSVCFACHKGMGKGDKNSVLGGIDAIWYLP